MDRELLCASGENGYHHPGRPLPLIQRMHVQDRIVQRIRDFLCRRGFVAVPAPGSAPPAVHRGVAGDPLGADDIEAPAFPWSLAQLHLEEVLASGTDAAYCEHGGLCREGKPDGARLMGLKRIEFQKRDMTLQGLCDFQEQLLKDVAGFLTAADVGGANLTRLDRMMRAEHPRLTYRQALALLQAHGFTISCGDDLGGEEEAALVYHCGMLPLHVTHFPEGLRTFDRKIARRDPRVEESVDYILPLSGVTVRGALRESDVATVRPPLHGAAAGLEVARLLQYFMGVDSIRDAIALPQDRSREDGPSRVSRGGDGAVR